MPSFSQNNQIAQVERVHEFSRILIAVNQEGVEVDGIAHANPVPGVSRDCSPSERQRPTCRTGTCEAARGLISAGRSQTHDALFPFVATGTSFHPNVNVAV